MDVLGLKNTSLMLFMPLLFAIVEGFLLNYFWNRFNITSSKEFSQDVSEQQSL